MEYDELSPNDLPARYEPDWQKIQSDTGESAAMEASFYLLREATQWMSIIASLRPEAPLDRNRAIVRGLVVRFTKLLRLTLRELKDRETFQQLSITRDALETLGTLLYLLRDDDTGARFDQYVMNSLVAERELLQDIRNNVAQRNGQTWPIEERIERSINATARAAGIDDVLALPGRSRIGYPKAEDRVKLLGPNAYIGYRMGSAETHGDWNDLYRNHLRYNDTDFSPNLDSLHVRPQNPLTLTILCAEIIGSNITAIADGESAQNFTQPALNDIESRARRLNDLHEAAIEAQARRTQQA